MKLTGTIAEFPDARFTPNGEYRVYVWVQVTEAVRVECVLKDFPAEDFMQAIYNKPDSEVVGTRVAVRGVETIRRFRKFDGGTGAHSYINVTELVVRIDGEPQKFGGR